MDQFPLAHEYFWNERQKIGQGGFGTVFKVQNKSSKEFVAVKELDMAKFDEDYKRDALKNQIIAMKQLGSQNTVTMYNFCFGNLYTYIILELCQSDLKMELASSGEHFPENKCVQIYSQILQGFKVLVNHGYIHRDIKPENILIKNQVYKIADYGFSRKVKIDQEKLRQICGTPLYMAPQLLYSKQYTSKCDIWSLGLVFYEMLFGYSPWATRHVNVMKQAVINKPVAFPYNCRIGMNVKDFIERCLQLEESNRLSWKQAFQHPLYVTKQKGPPLTHTQVDDDLLKILIRVQQSSSRKFINVTELFDQYKSKTEMDLKSFHGFMSRIDPQITSYESHKIFQKADTSKNGLVQLEEFKKLYIEVDYRPVEDIATRRIEEIVKMAIERKINLQQFFDLFDKNKSSEIDPEQFQSFIKFIAPAISNAEIRLMWIKFDKDKSGTITMDEFINQMTRGVPGQKKPKIENLERAKRNVECLRDFLVSRKISSEQLFGKANVKHGDTMKFEEFMKLVQSINYVITKTEIEDMFVYIDENNSGSIDLSETKQLLGY